MERDYRRRRDDAVPLPFGFAPQVLPALLVAEWLTGSLSGKRHRTRCVEGGGKGTR